MDDQAALSAGPGEEGAQSPRYVQIVQALRERIARSDYPLGGMIPTEAELCAEFAASRFTVREALRRLVESGMVERRKGSGTVVIASAPRASFAQSMRSLSELFQYAVATRFEIARAELCPLDAETAELLAADVGAPWLRIEGTRRFLDDATAISSTLVHVDGRFAPLLPDVRDLRSPIYAAVEARSGETIAEAIQEIRAEPMTAETAAMLGAPAGTWALVVQRRYIGRDGRTLLCSLNRHPADRYRYTMRIQREDGAL